jgi:hypothetical protein
VLYIHLCDRMYFFAKSELSFPILDSMILMYANFLQFCVIVLLSLNFWREIDRIKSFSNAFVLCSYEPFFDTPSKILNEAAALVMNIHGSSLEKLHGYMSKQNIFHKEATRCDGLIWPIYHLL